MKKKLFATIVVTAALICACGSESGKAPASVETKSTTAESVSGTTEAEAKGDAISTEETTVASNEVSIEKQELYNQDGIVITATGIKMDGFMGPEITLLVENGSTKNITVQVRNSSINGYMADFQMSCDVVAGKKANDSMKIMNSSLKDCGIDSIANLEFSFHIFDTASFDAITDSDMITLKTNIADGYEQTYDDSGDILYDTDGVKIVSKGLFSDSSFFGPEFKMYIENNTDQNITIQVRDTSINGFMVNPSMSADIMPGKHAVDEITFLNSDLETNGITTVDDIESIETAFHIFKTDSFEAIADSDPITINFK